MTQTADRALATPASVGVIVDPFDLGQAVQGFVTSLEGHTNSVETIRAYTTALGQFVTWLLESSSGIHFNGVQSEDVGST